MVTRSAQAALYMSQGKIFFRKDAPWLLDLEAEVLLFNNGIHDDQVNTYCRAVTSVHALDALRESRDRSGIARAWAGADHHATAGAAEAMFDPDLGFDGCRRPEGTPESRCAAGVHPLAVVATPCRFCRRADFAS